MRKTIFNVKGMFCSYCLVKVIDVVRALDGIKSVQISFEEEMAEVEYDAARISVNRIKTVVERSGFSVVALA
ncbi:hypothetical protein AGMMS50276_22820 [Synergistales bacterium]|nr:hypothetical protein AGMMS50276_22820 [Synergistales bacterium]